MISGGGRILDTIELIIKYDISIISNTALRARTEITTKGSDSNLTTILKDRASNSELSDISKDFKSIAVNNDDDDDNIKKPQLKKRKRNKCYYTKNITHGFQSNIANNKKMDIIKYM